ncbi:immunity 49 family protein [Streptomyces sp. RY43-2]|uniref:Immunity 49 family protein n=1 Tax=Streptomyces macrolidinus TaxID=2952607 RepID=A0ABT0Z865_9ACTN|nr:immunity 49 family protein [Streptomyces macrolidinus]MCN9239963.1 immunity 49 family protein [Streptomyces macrolidinus]
MKPMDTPDPGLPMLTAEQALHLRALAAPYAQDGHDHPLTNLAHMCRNVPEERWPDLVAEHFARLRQAGNGDESAEELLQGVHARLLPVDSFTPELAEAMRYVRVVADGLVFAFALDQPTTVRILTDNDVERAGLENLGEAAYANLMRVPVVHEEVPIEGRARLHSLYGDSPFVSSKALYLSEAVRQATGEPLPDAGALVAVPNRHLLVYHPITDGTVVDAVNDLGSCALGAYEDGPGSLSPRVYWWYRGSLTSLTVIDDEARTFSVQPPPHLLGLMKGLVRLDGAGRLATSSAEKSPEASELARDTAQLIAGLAEAPAGWGEAFASALTLAHVHCAADPEAADADTWGAWAAALQLGCALFTGGQSQECYVDEDRVSHLPATSAAPPADARAWLDALYLAIVCRQRDRISRLCEVPLATLRQDDSVDEYVLHWIDTLRTYFSERSMDDVVEKLIATMDTSMPDAVTHAPKDFVNRIDYQPVALFHRLIARDHDAFDEALSEALTEHGGYWGESRAPRAQVALGPLAMASLAYDFGFPIGEKHPYMPMYLLNRERIEVIPSA